MTVIKNEKGNWTDYRARFGLTPADEIDLHFANEHSHSGWHEPYDDKMATVENLVLQSLQTAQANDRSYIMFMHGWSTSRPGKTTARSVVRRVMRSSAATPYVVRAECIQHNSVFVAKVKKAMA